MADDVNVGLVQGTILLSDSAPAQVGELFGAMLISTPVPANVSLINLTVLMDEYPVPPPPPATGEMLCVQII